MAKPFLSDQLLAHRLSRRLLHLRLRVRRRGRGALRRRGAAPSLHPSGAFLLPDGGSANTEAPLSATLTTAPPFGLDTAPSSSFPSYSPSDTLSIYSGSGPLTQASSSSPNHPSCSLPTEPGSSSRSSCVAVAAMPLHSPVPAALSSPTAAASSSSPAVALLSNPNSYTPYVAISVYVAKGHLLFRRGYEEKQELIERGKSVNDLCIHNIMPVPKYVGYDFSNRNFFLKDESMLQEIKEDWYAIVKPTMKNEDDKYKDPDLFFVNGELQKHGKTIPQFSNGEEVVRFCLDRFRELDVRNNLRSLGDIGERFYDKLGSVWGGILRNDLKDNLERLFTLAPGVKVFKTGGRIFVHEYVFFFNINTGKMINPDAVPGTKWLQIMWGQNTQLDEKTIIFV